MKVQRQFFTAEGLPRFEKSVCVFVDVLGFAEFHKESEKQGTSLEELRRFHGVISKELAKLNEFGAGLAGGSIWQMKVFTDNIVLGVPVWTMEREHAESEIGYTVFNVADYQLSMACEGYFVRGGLALGNLFMDEHMAYGPALIEAYEIEHTHATNPRIVIAETVCDLIRRQFRFYSEPSGSPQNRWFLMDEDGRVFVNYLAPCLEPVDCGYDVDTEKLRLHKRNIERRLGEASEDPKNFRKYAWLAAYHNWVVNNWSEFGLVDRDLCIDDRHGLAPAGIQPMIRPL